MSMSVTVRQLREHLPDILDRAVKDDQPCIIELNALLRESERVMLRRAEAMDR